MPQMLCMSAGGVRARRAVRGGPVRGTQRGGTRDPATQPHRIWVGSFGWRKRMLDAMMLLVLPFGPFKPRFANSHCS
jgi:hypothetical protein